MPVVRVRGTRREMGIQHGRKTKDLIQRAVKQAWNTIPGLLKISKSDISRDLEQYSDWISRCHSGFRDEMEGVAEGARARYDDIVLLNSQYDIMLSRGGERAVETLLCSAFAAWQRATRYRDVVAGHNDDGPRFTDQFLVLLDGKPRDGHRFLIPVVPGFIGYHTVVNDAGFCAFGNSLENGPVPQEAGVGVPMYVIFRYLAEFADGVESALQFINNVRLGIVCSFLLTDRTGNAAIVHKTPNNVAVIRPTHDFLVLTNHALVEEVKPHLIMREYPSSSHFRFQSMEKAVKRNLGRIDLNRGMDIMSTHYDSSVGRDNPSGNTPCRHCEYEGRLSGTCRSGVVNLGKRRIKLSIALGNPCIAQWIEIKMNYRAIDS